MLESRRAGLKFLFGLAESDRLIRTVYPNKYDCTRGVDLMHSHRESCRVASTKSATARAVERTVLTHTCRLIKMYRHFLRSLWNLNGTARWVRPVHADGSYKDTGYVRQLPRYLIRFGRRYVRGGKRKKTKNEGNSVQPANKRGPRHAKGVTKI